MRGLREVVQSLRLGLGVIQRLTGFAESLRSIFCFDGTCRLDLREVEKHFRARLPLNMAEEVLFRAIRRLGIVDAVKGVGKAIPHFLPDVL